MSINGVGTARYSMAEYTAKTVENNAPENNFLDAVSKKATVNTIDYDEKLFENIAPNAPEEVKTAWKEATKEAGINGLGMKPNGMLGHISQMMIQQVISRQNGKTDWEDVLGNSVETAWQAANKALSALENPLTPITQKKLEVQEQIKKEREFYKSFMAKLEQFL